MKRWRGFRLGRRLVKIWNCTLLRRPMRYLRRGSSPPRRTKSCFFNWVHSLFPGGGGGSGYRRLESGIPGDKPPPKGHLAVYVGGLKDEGGSKRYVLPVIYFNHPLFGELLREAEEEFGYQHPGGITIPCPVARFETVRTRIAEQGHHRTLPHHLPRCPSHG